MKWFVDGIVIN